MRLLRSRNYNNALVLLRFVGFIFVMFGLLGFVYVGIVVALVVQRTAPEWFIGSLQPYLASSVTSSPIYVLFGVLILGPSKRLARFITKHAVPEASGN
jgi:hypothetical protein